MVEESILHPIKMYNQNKKQMSSYMYKFYFSYVKFNKKLFSFTLSHDHLHSQSQPRAPKIQTDNYNIYQDTNMIS